MTYSVKTTEIKQIYYGKLGNIYKDNELYAVLVDNGSDIASEIAAIIKERDELAEKLAIAERRVNIACTGAEMTSELNAALRAENERLRAHISTLEKVSTQFGGELEKLHNELYAENNELRATLRQIGQAVEPEADQLQNWIAGQVAVFFETEDKPNVNAPEVVK